MFITIENPLFCLSNLNLLRLVLKLAMKKIKKFLMILSALLASIVVLIGLYFLFNCLQFHTPQKQNNQQLNLYIRELDSAKSDPYQFVAQKFDTHDIVFLGEVHKRKQD